ncbi:metallopeptidase family protein [Actinomyces minihominis]|uniref:metallopeptidase family protein n=1 Tax=Actinomyces minihominis TaxID=2002838 RepID=UPI001F5C8FAE|nr:metallopeptidase family protein [Actinomyces minihominis]
MSEHTYRSPDRLRLTALTSGIPRPSAPVAPVRRRDRHGRGARGPRFHPALPVWATRKERFYEEVVLAVSDLSAREPAISEIEFGIQDVPPSDPAEWESHDVVLARTFPRDRRRGLGDRIVLYRLPIMSRTKESEVALALRVILAERICDVLAIHPEDLLG